MRATRSLIRDPQNDFEEAQMDQLLQQRKTEMLSLDQLFIRSQTPRDDTPEAEKKLRKELNPQGYPTETNYHRTVYTPIVGRLKSVSD